MYKEDFNKFLKAISEAVDYVKTELMPDFDFDAFNHEEAYDADGNYIAPAGQDFKPTEAANSTSQDAAVLAEPDPIVEQEIDPATITEKKPLEARDTPASQGDNLSNEEVDKW